jgi:hypothetical protein
MKPDDSRLRTAAQAASIASTYIDRVRIGSSGTDLLDDAEQKLELALSELTVTRLRVVAA